MEKAFVMFERIILITTMGYMYFFAAATEIGQARFDYGKTNRQEETHKGIGLISSN